MSELLAPVPGDAGSESDGRDLGPSDLRAFRAIWLRAVARRLRPPRKTVVLKRKKGDTIAEYNPIFAHAMFELGVGAEVASHTLRSRKAAWSRSSST